MEACLNMNYCWIYDGYYDEKGEWKSKICSDDKCEYCSKRPGKHPENCKKCAQELNKKKILEIRWDV